jgi:hypothetical protein
MAASKEIEKLSFELKKGNRLLTTSEIKALDVLTHEVYALRDNLIKALRGQGMPVKDIAAIFDVSPARISQLTSVKRTKPRVPDIIPRGDNET